MQNARSIVAQSVAKDFPSGEETVRVLHGVSLQAYAGELAMLVGPSGCGKTTLLSVLSGILSATEGHVWIGDTEITALSGHEKVLFRRQKMGFIFQQYHLLPALTAAENAAVPLVAAGMKLAEAAERAKALLEEIGMQGHTHKLPSQLSGGQQQRVAIARALVHDPMLILCDEPTAALDAHTGHLVMELLAKIARDPRRAVLAVTHDNRIFHFANRIFHMDDGKIEKEETR